MFSDRFGIPQLADILVPREDYRPFPIADSRPEWQALSADLRQARIAAGEKYSGWQWPALPATRYMDYSRDGDRSRFEGVYFARRSALAELVIAECVEGAGRFIDDIINGIWHICEETSWVVPAHNQWDGARDPLPDAGKPTIDLFAGETAGLLAWTHYLLRNQLDAVSAHVSARIRYEVARRVLDPFLDRDDFPWMGLAYRGRLNNWNPWCSSNCLIALLLLEAARDRRAVGIAKVLRILDRFLDAYLPDGGCDEGPGYWTRAGASLFDCLELLHGASRGRIAFYDQPLIQEIGRYIMRAHISGDYFVNFADCAPQVRIPAHLVYSYGLRIGDPRLSALGSFAYHRLPRAQAQAAGGSLTRVLPALLGDEQIAATPADAPLLRDVWLDGIQVMAAREREGSDRGFYLAAKGGHNAENHNHNDVGQFIVYCDAQPVLIDAGVGTYTAKTFSPQRYEIWTMQSAYHNLPTVNGVQQQAGEGFCAGDIRYLVDDATAQLTLDIARAYPEAAGIISWRRTLRLRRHAGPCVEVSDDFVLRAASRSIVLSLMTPCEPRLEMPGTIILPLDGAADVAVTFDPGVLESSVECIELADKRLAGIWGNRLFRVLARARTPMLRGGWTLRAAKATD